MDEKDINISIEEKSSDVKLIRLEGILDAVTTPKLDSFMSSLVYRENTCIIADCSNLSYINSTGLASLILYHIQAKRRNGAFKLTSPSEFVKELMVVSGAKKILDIYETQDEAIKNWELSRKAV